MNRVLRRPMFRTGGSAEGITSGLSRQGYKNPGRVLPEDIARMKMSDIGNMDLGQLQKLSRSMSYRPQRNNLRDFLIGFGLDIASRPPSGSIFSTAAAAAKDPFDRYTAAKQEADAAQYATESDMFKTMLGAQADILAAEKEGKGGKEWAKQWELQEIGRLMNQISELEELDPNDPDYNEKMKKMPILQRQLEKLKPKNPFIDFFLNPEIQKN